MSVSGYTQAELAAYVDHYAAEINLLNSILNYHAINPSADWPYPYTNGADVQARLEYLLANPPTTTFRPETLKPNQIGLAFTPTFHFGQAYFYASGGVPWPGVGDRTNPTLVSCPPSLWRRTVWLHVSALGGPWFWEGNLVARLSGQPMFSMPLRFAGAGASPNLKLFPSAQTAGASPCADAYQFNDVAGEPMSPFTFICAADQIRLEESGSFIGTSDTRVILLVRSATIW